MCYSYFSVSLVKCYGRLSLCPYLYVTVVLLCVLIYKLHLCLLCVLSNLLRSPYSVFLVTHYGLFTQCPKLHVMVLLSYMIQLSYSVPLDLCYGRLTLGP